MKRYVPTRWSHLVGYSGVGALVRADNDLFAIWDIREWTDKTGAPAGEILSYVELLRGTLGLGKDLRQPPLSRELDNGAIEGTCVPASRFPAWTRCPSCGLLRLRPWGKAAPGEHGVLKEPRCTCAKHPRLKQVDWVLAHPDGGLDEVPWHWLAHPRKGTGSDCKGGNETPYLHLKRDEETGKWFLHCDRCRTRTGFYPKMTIKPESNEKNDPFKKIHDPSGQPWPKGKASTPVPSQQSFHILDVSDGRLYYPRVASGLVIPPESQVARGSVVDRLYRNHAIRDELASCRTEKRRASILNGLADEFGCTGQDLEDAQKEIDKGWPLYGETGTRGQLLEKEYGALTTPIPDQLEGEDFVTEHQTAAWRGLSLGGAGKSRVRALHQAVDRLVAVTRLREIRVFLGFSRIAQGFDDHIRPNTAGAKVESGGRLVLPDLDGSKDWLPAIELYGEGIFFTLDEAMLRRWERQECLVTRAAQLQQRFESAAIRFNVEPPSPLSPRFLLLHTLAHLLIRRLEAEAGYPAASIRERIYCGEGEAPMSGILAYVAVPDIVGSLGGIAELAEPGRFLRLLTGVFDHATWCSQDPVCAEHQGQGPSELNLAACHACALIPEPSCQYGDLLLDRVCVAGDLGGTIRSVLDFAEEG